MKSLLSRVVVGALVLGYASAPGDAAATNARSSALIASASRANAAIRGKSVQSAPCFPPPTAGTIFVGEPGSFGGQATTNYAGSYSGVAAGTFNAACTLYGGIMAGYANTVSGEYGVIGAGEANLETPEAFYAFIGAGLYNTVNAVNAGIATGQGNTVEGEAGGFSFIGGGQQNTIANASDGLPYGLSSFIGAGYNNMVAANYGVLGGGSTNSVTADYGAVAGGFGNTATGVQSFVGGGFENNASGKNGTIPGGTKNWANGINSFAAGTQAKAIQNGTFVWSDYVDGSNQVVSTGKNQFVARATGGFYLYSSTSLTGVALAPGSGSWSTLSDRKVKSGIENADDARVLAKLAEMPISEWSYKAQGTGVRHLGPMAQDFHAAFGLGEDDRHISTVDEEGVALAAIKALEAQNAALRASLRETRRSDDARLARLEERLDALEAHSRSAAKNATTKS